MPNIHTTLELISSPFLSPLSQSSRQRQNMAMHSDYFSAGGDGRSFRPSLPNTLPSYPSRSDSSSQYDKSSYGTSSRYNNDGGHPSKRSRPVTLTATHPERDIRSPPPLSSFYDTPRDPRYTVPESENDEEDDRMFRSRLGGGAGTKRSRDEDDYDEAEEERRREMGGGGKRRIIDVVGGGLGAVWQLCKAITFLPVTLVNAATSATATMNQHLMTEMDESGNEEFDEKFDEKSGMHSPGEYPFHTTTTKQSWVPSNLSSQYSNSTVSTPSRDPWVLVSPNNTRPVLTPTSSSGRRPLRRNMRKPSSKYTSTRRSLGAVGSMFSNIPLHVPHSPKKNRTRTNSLVGGGGGGYGGYGSGYPADDDEEEDESIRRFNERLKEMIREGKEALGQKVEVYYEGEGDIEDWDETER